MQDTKLGQSRAFIEEFTAKAGDIIDVRWKNGQPRFRTIVAKASFDKDQINGPGPVGSDSTSARWQVPSDGGWVAVIIAPDAKDFTAQATQTSGPPVKVYTADAISYGDLPRAQAETMINRVFELANERRMNSASRGTPPDGGSPDPKPSSKRLILDPKLCLAAQSHSMNMAEQDFAEHTGKDQSSQATRIGAVGFKATTTGEILSFGYGTPEDAIESWMTSTDGHRWNLLNPDWTHTGIGVYYKADDSGEAPYRYYWTMVFAVPQ